MKLHPMNAFGLPHFEGDRIRANRLEERLIPKVPFPHQHNFFQIMIVSAGSGWHEIDFERHVVKRGSGYLMKPGQVHDWKLNSKSRGYLIEFETRFLRARGVRSWLNFLQSFPFQIFLPCLKSAWWGVNSFVKH